MTLHANLESENVDLELFSVESMLHSSHFAVEICMFPGLSQVQKQ